MVVCGPWSIRKKLIDMYLIISMRYRIIISFIFFVGLMAVLSPAYAELRTISPEISVNPEGNFTVNQYLNKVGFLVSPLPETLITATFSGINLSGSTGCNQYNARYTSGSGAIIITTPVTTRMLCQPEVMDQEGDYLANLKHAALLLMNETHLLLYDEHEVLLVDYVSDGESISDDLILNSPFYSDMV